MKMYLNNSEVFCVESVILYNLKPSTIDGCGEAKVPDGTEGCHKRA